MEKGKRFKCDVCGNKAEFKGKLCKECKEELIRLLREDFSIEKRLDQRGW